MGYTASMDQGNARYDCDNCDVFMWDEDDIINHLSMWHGSADFIVKPGTPATKVQVGIAERMEQAGREIRELHEQIDAVFATLNGGKSAQEAAYQRGRREALEEAYQELVRVGYTGPAAIVRDVSWGEF